MISKKKLLQWNRSSGGIFFPEELEMFEKIDLGLVDKVEVLDGILGLYEFPADDCGRPIRSRGRCLDIGPNLIVNAGRAALASLQRTTAAGLTTIGVLDLGLLAVGSGSGGGAGHTPQPTDTALQTENTDPIGGPVVSGVPRPTLQVSTPPPGPPFVTNLWTAQIGTTQLNGVAIDEAATFCLDDSTMFSYRTFAAQTKASGFVIEIRWSHLF
jgi:hypothetical protein